MLARRSLYCSKHADGEHSVAKSFDDTDGNIWFQRIEHSWIGSSKWVSVTDKQGNTVKKFAEAKDGKCEFCSAPRAIFDRESELENHAYAFIHTKDIKHRVTELFGDGMQFDVIIGNPPYQMTGGAGGTSDSSIYHLFVEQATSAVAIPASCSFKIAMICSSLNLLRFISSDSLRQTLPKSGHISGEHVTTTDVLQRAVCACEWPARP